MQLHPLCDPPDNLMAVLSKMHLHLLYDTPDNLRALGAWRLVLAMSVCVGENPTCSVPVLEGCEGLRSHDDGHA